MRNKPLNQDDDDDYDRATFVISYFILSIYILNFMENFILKLKIYLPSKTLI